MTERNRENNYEVGFQEILNLFSEPAAIVTEDHRFVCINEALSSILGDQKAALLTKPIEELPFFTEEVKITIIANLTKRLHGEKVEPYEVPISINGRKVYFEPAGKKIDYLGKPCDVVILHDISKRRKLQTHLIEEIGKEKEKRLQSESKIASILGSSPDAVAFCSMDGKVLECNEAMIDLFRYRTKAELIGKNGFELLLIDDSANASKAINDLLEKGIVSNAELRSTTADGQELFVIFSGRRLNDSSGSPIGFVAVAKDITQHRRIETSLQQRLQFENMISTISSRFVSCVDFDVAVNASLAEVGNLCRADRSYIFLLDNNTKNATINNVYEWCAQKVSPKKDSRQNISVEAFSWWMKKLAAGENIQINDVSKMPTALKAQSEMLRQQGVQSIIVLPLLIANQLGGFLGLDNIESAESWPQENLNVLRVFADLVGAAIAKNRASADLQKSQKRLADITSNVNDWVWEVNAEGRYVYSNDAVKQILGYSQDEIVGKHYYDLFLPAEQERLRKKADKVSELKSRFSGLICNKVHKNGSTVILEVSGVPILNVHGAVVGYRGADRDVTAHKRAEYALKEAHDQLESVVASTGAGLVLVSRDYKVVWCNSLIKQTFGDNLVNKKCHLGIHNSEVICPDCGVRQVFEGAQIVSREVSGTGKDGKFFAWQMTVTPVKDKDGHLLGALELVIPITQQKEMETKLKEAETLYRSLFEQGPLGVVVIDPETTNIVQFNEVAHRQLGYSRDEFSKLQIANIEAQEKPQQIRRQIAKILREGQDEFVTQHRTKNGCIRSVLVNSRVILLSGGKMLLNTWHDVTGIKKMHNALRGSEEKFYAITNSVRDAIILVDKKAKVTYWNPAAETTFGYTSKEALGKSIHSLVVPSSTPKQVRGRIDTSVKTFAETGLGYFTVGNVELTGRRKDGTEFPAELSVAPIKLLGKWSAVGVVKDISRRKSAEQKLKDAEQRYHALFNQAPLGVLVVDPETAAFVEFNDITHLQLGYLREEFENKKIFDIEAKESEHETALHLKSIVQEGGSEFETLHRTKSGKIRNVLVTAKAFRSAGKNYLHCIYHDITEIRNVQRSLLASEARYRQLVEVAQEGIWAIDNSFTTTFVNPRMAEMLGYKETEILGKQLFDFIGKEMVGTIKGVLIEFSSGRPMKGQYEYAFPTKDGTRVHTNVTLSRIADNQGLQTGILAVISDITERKRVEKALKESEELSKAVVATSPIGIATVDKTYRFVSANEAFCKTLGYTEGELRKLTFKDLTHPDDILESAQKISELTSGRINSFMLEKHYIRKDRSTIVGRVIVSAIRNQNTHPILFIVELEDITVRKQLEGDLLASEERFRAISTSAMDAIVLCDEKDKVMYWNPAAEQTFGYLESEAMGKPLTKLIIPPQGHKNHSELVKEMIVKPSSKRHLGFSAQRRDGAVFPADASITVVKIKDKTCLLSIVRDVTEWKMLEEALRQERDMLENMAANINAGLAIIDRNYKVVWANRLLRKISGRKSIEDCYCYTAFGGESEGICQDCGVKKIFEDGVAIDRHDYHVKKRNHDTWVELIVTPIKDKDGKVIAALELAVDITERRQLQNKRVEYSQKLEQLVQQRTKQLKDTQEELVKSERLAAIGELASMVGHDLRNPLTGIKNSVYFMRKKGTAISQEQNREMLEIINRCVDSSNRIVNDLLDYSREIHLELEDTSPQKLLNEALSLIDVPNRVHIYSNLKDCKVKVDTDKIKRVFINLIKNAIDAMPNGGKINVKCRVTKGRLEVSIADTGTGISDEVLPKLFSPLITTKAQGMGFGLAICKRIIEAHGGTIKVKTTWGTGTTFTLKLPLEPKIESGGEKLWINYPESSLSTTTKPSEQP